MATATEIQDSLLQKLRDVFARAKLPSSPALAVQILELANNPNASTDQFAKLIQMDAVLCGRLLKMSNSALFAQRKTVTTIQRAVSVLGVERVRTVALGFQLVGHLNRLGNCPFDMRRFWQESLLRGCLAREVGSRVAPGHADEAFLIGLIQDSGILLLVQLLGKEYADLYQTSHLSPTAFHRAEREKFSATHVLAAKVMAREWGLPDAIAMPISCHHVSTIPRDDDPEIARLCKVSYLVGSMRLAHDAIVDETEPALNEFAKERLGLDEDALRACLTSAGEAYAQMAGLLQESVPEDLDVTDLLSEANRHCLSAAGEADAQIHKVQEETKRIREEQQDLKNALGKYRERAARDPLTEVLNRGGLAESARSCLAEAQAKNESITTLFLDIDNFKKLNDTHGHQAGDTVLVAVATTLKDLVRNAGIVGRYGGEEFVVVIPGLSNTEARQFAHQVVEAVRLAKIPSVQLPGPVTCSVGAVWGPAAGVSAVETLFKAADELMYKAKRSGKDRCVMQSSESFSTHTIAAGAGAAAVQAIASLARETAQQKASARQVIPEEFRRVAVQLNQNTPEHFVKMRKQQRKDLLAPCLICHFTGAMMGVKIEDAYVRNISSGGLGILTPFPLVRGAPVEVAILTQGTPSLYVAGLVAFCRHVDGAIHEVGIQLFGHAKEPLLSKDPITAVQNLQWVAEAIRDLHRSGGAG